MNYQAKLRVPVTDQDHTIGPQSAPLTVVEYGDYECPYCARAYYVVQRLRDALDDDLRVVFRNFPLTEVHPRALDAARAAEAAGLQGRFWEMHSLLFENRLALDKETLISFAASLGLDLHRFTSDMESARVEGKIDHDIEGGARSGVNGTPTFFVNGVRYDGDWAFESFLGELTALSRGAP